eukprot:2159682-Rhodomonas_salina.1
MPSTIDATDALRAHSRRWACSADTHRHHRCVAINHRRDRRAPCSSSTLGVLCRRQSTSAVL